MKNWVYLNIFCIAVSLLMFSCTGFDKMVKSLERAKLQSCNRFEGSQAGSWPTFSEQGKGESYVTTGGVNIKECIDRLKGQK